MLFNFAIFTQSQNGLKTFPDIKISPHVANKIYTKVAAFKIHILAFRTFFSACTDKGKRIKKTLIHSHSHSSLYCFFISCFSSFFAVFIYWESRKEFFYQIHKKNEFTTKFYGNFLLINKTSIRLRMRKTTSFYLFCFCSEIIFLPFHFFEQRLEFSLSIFMNAILFTIIFF